VTTTKPKPTDEEETKGLGLSPATVAGGALASVTSTVAASSLGTAGTIWGAGVGSIISTVAAALYAHTLKRGAKTLSTVIPVNAPPGSTAVPGRDSTKVMDSPIPGDDRKVLPTRLDPRAPKPKRFDITLDRKFWIKVALAAVGMFILVMGVITAPPQNPPARARRKTPPRHPHAPHPRPSQTPKALIPSDPARRGRLPSLPGLPWL
jgi:hypothetical protein